MERVFFFCIFFHFLLFLSVDLVFGQVVINEILVNPVNNPPGSSLEPDEFIELLNLGENIYLEGYKIQDKVSTYVIPAFTFSSGEYFFVKKIESSIALNNSGDVVVLTNSQGDEIDSFAYTQSSIEGKSWSRVPDGTGNFINNTDPTEGMPNVEKPTFSENEFSTPTLSNKPNSATYNIYTVKDDTGDSLSNVKIYLDGVYIHHYAPETLTFCSDCVCDGEYDCRFGNHIIRLEKKGYEDWSRSVNIEERMIYDVNPVMNKISTISPSVTVENDGIPTNTLSGGFGNDEKQTEQAPDNETSGDGKLGNIVLGIQNKIDSIGKDEIIQASKESENIYPGGAILIILGGLAFIGAAAYPFLRFLIKSNIKVYEEDNENKT